MSIALILAGHGSHISPNTAGIVWDYVDKLRTWAVADEITAAFWKEAPDFRAVLETIQADTVVIVPVFTAQGFFTTRLIPAEMQLNQENKLAESSIYQIGNKRVFYTRTLGEHPYVSKIIQERIASTLLQAQLSADDVTIAVIGHGTRRMSNSQDATYQQAERLRLEGLYPQVLDVYLDADPDIASIYQNSQQSKIIAVPFFLADGSHVSQDVPEALGINYGDFPAQQGDYQVYYTPPVGTDESICELILELARESGFPFQKIVAENPLKDWQNFPQFGTKELLSELEAQDGELLFGQIVVKFDTVYPIDSSKQIILESSKSLRQHIRENPYRPMSYQADLPQDWVVPINSQEQISAVIETIYPQALADWALYRRGELQQESLADLIARQVGMFAEIVLEETRISETVTRICGRCTRQPLWAETIVKKELPCPRACNYWLSAYQGEE